MTPDPRAYTMSEDALQKKIRDMCKERRLRVEHFPDARRCWLPGWPDLFIWGPRGALARELKAHGGGLTTEQRSVGGSLICAGIDWSEWRPRDLLNGTIARQLDRIAGLDKEAT